MRVISLFRGMGLLTFPRLLLLFVPALLFALSPPLVSQTIRHYSNIDKHGRRIQYDYTIDPASGDTLKHGKYLLEDPRLDNLHIDGQYLRNRKSGSWTFSRTSQAGEAQKLTGEYLLGERNGTWVLDDTGGNWDFDRQAIHATISYRDGTFAGGLHCSGAVDTSMEKGIIDFDANFDSTSAAHGNWNMRFIAQGTEYVSHTNFFHGILCSDTIWEALGGNVVFVYYDSQATRMVRDWDYLSPSSFRSTPYPFRDTSHFAWAGYRSGGLTETLFRVYGYPFGAFCDSGAISAPLRTYLILALQQEFATLGSSYFLDGEVYNRSWWEPRFWKHTRETIAWSFQSRSNLREQATMLLASADTVNLIDSISWKGSCGSSGAGMHARGNAGIFDFAFSSIDCGTDYIGTLSTLRRIGDSIVADIRFSEQLSSCANDSSSSKSAIILRGILIGRILKPDVPCKPVFEGRLILDGEHSFEEASPLRVVMGDARYYPWFPKRE